MDGPCAKPIYVEYVRSFNFPVGEMHIQLPEEVLSRKFVDINYSFSGRWVVSI